MIGFFLIGFKICIEEVGKEKYLKNGKHDEKFYQSYSPKSFANGHTFKSIAVKNV